MTDPWREPSVLDVAIETTRTGINGPGPWRWRNVWFPIAFIVVAVLLLLKFGTGRWSPSLLTAPLLFTITLAYRAGRRQQILGRERSRVATAVVVTFAAAIAFLGLMIATSQLIGPGEDDAPFSKFLEALDSAGTTSLFVTAFFVGLAAVAVVAHRRNGPIRKAAEAALQEEARVERAARERVGRVRSKGSP